MEANHATKVYLAVRVKSRTNSNNSNGGKAHRGGETWLWDSARGWIWAKPQEGDDEDADDCRHHPAPKGVYGWVKDDRRGVIWAQLDTAREACDTCT